MIIKTKRNIYKLVALVTLSSFLLTNTAWSMPDGGLALMPKMETPSFLQVEIPSDLASVEEIYEAPAKENPKLILNIQDIHGNYESQVQISKLLQYLYDKFGFKLLFAEGAAEKLNMDLLRFFPDAERNRKLADLMAKNGELTGIEYFMMDGPKDVEAVGIEKTELYRQNYEAFKKVYGAVDDVNAFLELFESRLETLSSRIFSPNTRRILSEWRKFEAGHRDFLPYVKSMAAEAKTVLNLDLESLFAQVEWPQITRLLALQSMEADLDRKAADQDRQRLIAFLADQKIDPKIIHAIETLDEKKISMTRTEAEARKEDLPRYLFERLVDEAGPKGFQFHDYPAFSLWAGHLILQNELDSKILFEEIETIFTKVLTELTVSEREKNLMELTRDEILLRKFLHLEVTRKEWERAVYRKDWMVLSAMVGRLKKISDDISGDMKLNADDWARFEKMAGEAGASKKGTLSPILEASYEFYDFARKREAVFFSTIENTMNEKKIEKAVLVTGGFHTDGLMDMFRENQFNASILMPRISGELDNSAYVSTMMENKPSMFDIGTMQIIMRAQALATQAGLGANGKEIVARLVQEVMQVGNVSLEEAKTLVAEALKITIATQEAPGKKPVLNVIVPAARTEVKVPAGVRRPVTMRAESRDAIPDSLVEGLIENRVASTSVDAAELLQGLREDRQEITWEELERLLTLIDWDLDLGEQVLDAVYSAKLRGGEYVGDPDFTREATSSAVRREGIYNQRLKYVLDHFSDSPAPLVSEEQVRLLLNKRKDFLRNKGDVGEFLSDIEEVLIDPFDGRYAQIRETTAAIELVTEAMLERSRRFLNTEGLLPAAQRVNASGSSLVFMIPPGEARNAIAKFQAVFSPGDEDLFYSVPPTAFHITLNGIDPADIRQFKLLVGAPFWDPSLGIAMSIKLVSNGKDLTKIIDWGNDAKYPPHITVAYLKRPLSLEQVDQLNDTIARYENKSFGILPVLNISEVEYADLAFSEPVKTLRTFDLRAENRLNESAAILNIDVPSNETLSAKNAKVNYGGTFVAGRPLNGEVGEAIRKWDGELKAISPNLGLWVESSHTTVGAMFRSQDNPVTEVDFTNRDTQQQFDLGAVINAIAAASPYQVEFKSIGLSPGKDGKGGEGNLVLIGEVKDHAGLGALQQAFQAAGLNLKYSAPKEGKPAMAFVTLRHLEADTLASLTQEQAEALKAWIEGHKTLTPLKLDVKEISLLLYSDRMLRSGAESIVFPLGQPGPFADAEAFRAAILERAQQARPEARRLDPKRVREYKKLLGDITVAEALDQLRSNSEYQPVVERYSSRQGTIKNFVIDDDDDEPILFFGAAQAALSKKQDLNVKLSVFPQVQDYRAGETFSDAFDRMVIQPVRDAVRPERSEVKAQQPQKPLSIAPFRRNESLKGSPVSLRLTVGDITINIHEEATILSGRPVLDRRVLNGALEKIAPRLTDAERNTLRNYPVEGLNPDVLRRFDSIRDILAGPTQKILIPGQQTGEKQVTPLPASVEFPYTLGSQIVQAFLNGEAPMLLTNPRFNVSAVAGGILPVSADLPADLGLFAGEVLASQPASGEKNMAELEGTILAPNAQETKSLVVVDINDDLNEDVIRQTVEAVSLALIPFSKAKPVLVFVDDSMKAGQKADLAQFNELIVKILGTEGAKRLRVHRIPKVGSKNAIAKIKAGMKIAGSEYYSESYIAQSDDELRDYSDSTSASNLIGLMLPKNQGEQVVKKALSGMGVVTLSEAAKILSVPDIYTEKKYGMNMVNMKTLLSSVFAKLSVAFSALRRIITAA